MILLTGGAGFIGSVLCHALNQKGRQDIYIVDRLGEDQKWQNLKGLKYEQYIHADKLFNEKLYSDKFWKKITIIYHMGACSATTERNVDFLMENNLEYSQKLFQKATEKNIPIVYASSAATYGDGEQGYKDDMEGLGKLLPLNAYGYSKQLFDEWVLRQVETPSIWYGLKFFNVYGPNETHKAGMRSVVQQAFEQIQANGSVKLFKSYRTGFEHGEQKRDFIYVKDVCRAMIELIDRDGGRHSGIYNMGTGVARSFNDLVNATFHALSLPPHIEYVEMPDALKNQYQYFTQADMENFLKVLPNFHFSSLEDGVSDYVKHHLLKTGFIW